MKFHDKSVKDFTQELLAEGLDSHKIAELFHAIEAHENPREIYWERSTYEQHLKSEDRVFYTEEKGELTSFIFYQEVKPEIEVTHWAVKHKGCGEGGAVFGLFLSQIASRAYKIILECGEWNKRALYLYAAFQFNKVAFRPKYYRTGEGAWILERSHNS
ncbi:MAG: hypothetical protein R3A80_08165 [Bdellovibrionota bacterium]